MNTLKSLDPKNVIMVIDPTDPKSEWRYHGTLGEWEALDLPTIFIPARLKIVVIADSPQMQQGWLGGHFFSFN